MNTSAFSHSPGFPSTVHTAPPEVSVCDAARIMHWRNVGVVVVVKHHRPVGIVTDRDLAIRVVANGLDSRSTTLGRIMTAAVLTVAADASDEQISHQLAQAGVCQIPLVDNAGNIVGLAAWARSETQVDSPGAVVKVVRSTALVPMIKRRKFRRVLYGAQQELRQHARWIGATVALAAIGAALSLVTVGYWNPWSAAPVMSLHASESNRSGKSATETRPPSHADPNPASASLTPPR